ncbi:TetR/AcrR family transcriptional regulator [Gorillibacterium timonense]|uniref:TetR/AcrR family transcriptional regulator n=1 Tax=Gorillibacterium timonense TaxID=1689269 RepID=UPI00071E5E29|nr:TetR/AcrR family transcriptional regulator [Gorillibacterium timonense]
MYEKFHSLEQEKQDRILNAGMKEFAVSGFERASTNTMVKEAGISKGLLFHYFANKKQFFLYLFDYAVELSIKEFFKTVDWSEPDLFVHLQRSMKTKLEVWHRYPELFKFIETAYLETSGQVRPEMEEKIRALHAKTMPEIFKGVDFSRFREGLDTEKATRIIVWSLEKLGDYLLEVYKPIIPGENRYEEMTVEAETYLGLLKHAFYSDKGGSAS